MGVRQIHRYFMSSSCRRGRNLMALAKMIQTLEARSLIGQPYGRTAVGGIVVLWKALVSIEPVVNLLRWGLVNHFF